MDCTCGEKTYLLLLVVIWGGVLVANHRLTGWSAAGYRGGQIHRGTVVEAGEDENTLRVRLQGQGGDEAVMARYAGGSTEIGAQPGPGRRVFVEIIEQQGETRAHVVGLVRDRTLLFMLGIFLTLFTLVGGRRAAGGLAGLVAAGGGVSFVLVPMLLAGFPPNLSVLVTSLLILAAVSMLISGVKWRTLAIMGGGLGGLALTYGLSLLACRFFHLTGVYSTLTDDLWRQVRHIDFVGLIAAGIAFGALGVVIDLAMGVGSAVFEVADVNPAMSRRRLMRSGMSVGRDIMGTEINTLLFAYAGARIGLLLLPFFGPLGYRLPLTQVLSLQEIAVEVAYIAVGTAGLVLTIPITSLISSFLAHRPTESSEKGMALPGGRSHPLVPVAGAACWILLGAAALWLNSGTYHSYESRPGQRTRMHLSRAKVTGAEPGADEVLAGEFDGERVQHVEATILSGPFAGNEVSVHNPISGFPGNDKAVGPGHRVLVRTHAGGSSQQIAHALILDYERLPEIIIMVVVLGVLIIAVGGRQGVRSLTALALCLPLLGGALLLVAGLEWPALPVFAVAALLMCLIVFTVLSGISRKTAGASAGAFCGIIAGGIAAETAAATLDFTGLQSGSLIAIRMFADAGGIDYRGLLSAGILLGIVGVSMDIAIAGASAATEISIAGNQIGRKELWQRSLNVGRKVMCTMVLALALAYAGANMALLFLPGKMENLPLLLAINNDRFAIEGLRLIAGGIGIVVTIPATAFLSSIFIARGMKDAADPTDQGD